MSNGPSVFIQETDQSLIIDMGKIRGPKEEYDILYTCLYINKSPFKP